MWLIKQCSLCAGGRTSQTWTVDGTKYVKIKKLGEGGFSNVYLVQETSGDRRKYAIKQMVCHSKRELQRAQFEIELHRRCESCPMVLSCVASDVSTSSSNDTVMVYQAEKGLSQASEVLMVLPYCKKGTLHDELMVRKTNEDQMDESRVLRLFHGVCVAIAHLHSLQPPVAHRDIKPANVLLSDDDSPLVMDLGSATEARVDISDKSGAQLLQDDAAEMCSMAYRPPELFSIDGHSAIDERTDVWSLGCLLYAMCFYESPFDAVYARGDSVALAVQSANSIKIPDDSPYSSELHQLIRRLTNTDMYMRPNMKVIMQVVESMMQTTKGATNA